MTQQRIGRSRRSTLARALSAATAATLAIGMLAGGSSAAFADDVAPMQAKLNVYVEVNSHDFSNVAKYTLAGTEQSIFDTAIIFAANINYDGTRPYLHLNERVTETLNDAKKQIRPVQARGTKVLLSVLGNHQGVGFANFESPAQADAFAKELADVVTTYGLDGIDFDDEYARYDKNIAPINDKSFGWLVTALRERLGADKLITLYAIGESYDRSDWSSFDTTSTIDFSWNPYYPTYREYPIPGLDRSKLGAAAIDLENTSVATAKGFAQRTVDDGFGFYNTYNLTARDTSALFSSITTTIKGATTTFTP